MNDNLFNADELSEFDKSCQLVGQYLSAWAHMESQMNISIRNGLSLNVLQGAIVCANAGFTSKCHILQTLVGLGKPKQQLGQSSEDSKLFSKLKSSSTDRNTVAHCQFFPKKTKKGDFGVDFFVVHAKGEFNLPNVHWTEKAFNKKIEELYQLADSIEKYSKYFSQKKVTERLVEALRNPSPQKPTLGLLGLGLIGSQYPLPQAGLLSDNLFATPEKLPQTPPIIEESEQ